MFGHSVQLLDRDIKGVYEKRLPYGGRLSGIHGRKMRKSHGVKDIRRAVSLRSFIPGSVTVNLNGRTALLVLLLTCMGASWLIENPSSTLMFDFPLLRKTLVLLKKRAGTPVPLLDMLDNALK